MVPSGISIATKTTRWSSSGRNEVCVVLNICHVMSTVSTSSIAARISRRASALERKTKSPLNLLMPALNQASGPCLKGRASCRRSEQRAGASVSAQRVEKQTAAESVTENCW